MVEIVALNGGAGQSGGVEDGMLTSRESDALSVSIKSKSLIAPRVDHRIWGMPFENGGMTGGC